MPSLEATNLILGVIAVATAAQFLTLLAAALWVTTRIARLEKTVGRALSRFETDQLPELSGRITALVDDLRRVAERVDRVGHEAERATRIVQDALHVLGAEVERAARGVRLAFDVVEGGMREVRRMGAGVRGGVRAGLHELFSRPAPGGEPQRGEGDTVAQLERGA